MTPLRGQPVQGLTDGFQGMARNLRLVTAALKDLMGYASLEARDVRTTGLLLNPGHGYFRQYQQAGQGHGAEQERERYRERFLVRIEALCNVAFNPRYQRLSFEGPAAELMGRRIGPNIGSLNGDEWQVREWGMSLVRPGRELDGATQWNPAMESSGVIRRDRGSHGRVRHLHGRAEKAVHMDDKHINRLTKNPDHHRNGACIVRHAAAQNAECKYAKNGYNITLRDHQKHYNSPRYDPAKATGIRTKTVSLTQPDGAVRKLITPKQQQYWHHLIANEMLSQELFDENRENPYQLFWLKDQLDKALDDKEVHKIDPKSVQHIKDDLNKISDNLFLILEQMPGGLHINKIQDLGASIEAKLRQQGNRR